MSEIHLSEDIANYIRNEIQRRTGYKVRLENTDIYEGYDDFSRRQNKQKRDSLQYSINALTDGILKIAKRHMPSVEIDPQDHEISISNILQALPALQKVKRYTLVSGRE
jgi:hypothetical protein